jgi:hypothetical protein
MSGLKWRLFVLLAVVCCCTPLVAQAQWPTSSSYSVTHSYTFSGVAGLPSVAFLNYGVNARAFEPIPGWDTNGRSGQWAIVGTGGFSDVVRAGTDRPRLGFTDAGATAGVNASVLNWGGTYSASMTSYGSAHAQFVPDWAAAGSWMNTRIWAPTTWRFGRIVWRPVINDFVGGSALAQGNRWRPVRNRDPIVVSGLDAGGNSQWVQSFFDVFLETAGELNWGDTGFMASDSSGAVDLELNIDMTNPLLASRGLLNLEILDGVVTTSEATGIFAGMGIPTVGTPVGGTLSLPGLTNEFTLDYDLTGLPAVEGLMFELGGDGGAIAPEPTTLSMLAVGGLCLLVFAWRRKK